MTWKLSGPDGLEVDVAFVASEDLKGQLDEGVLTGRAPVVLAFSVADVAEAYEIEPSAALKLLRRGKIPVSSLTELVEHRNSVQIERVRRGLTGQDRSKKVKRKIQYAHLNFEFEVPEDLLEDEEDE